MPNVIILNDTSSEHHHGCELVIKNLKKLLIQKNLTLIGTNYCGRSFLSNRSLLRKLHIADLVIVNGEGTLHSSQPRALILMKDVEYIKKKTMLPIVLVNAFYYNNNSEIIKLTRLFDLIFVRTSKDRSRLLKYNIKSRVVPDLVFYSGTSPVSKKNCTQISVTDGYIDSFSRKMILFAKKEKYNYLPIRTDRRIEIFNFKSVLGFIKYHLFKKILYLFWISGIKLNYLVEVKFYYTKNCINYLRKISKSKFLISGRFHAVCFAIKTLTPFFFMKYGVNTYKTEGLLLDIGIKKNRLLEYKKLNQFKIKEFNSIELKNIKKYILTAPKKIEKMFNDISKLLKK
jgi:hypothetical protein